MFDRRTAERDLDRYRSKGADRTTRMLLDLIGPHRVEGSTILDIGGGIGVIDQELLNAGAARAVLVDASPAYLNAARHEAARENVIDRMEFVDGDFVRRAAEIVAADIVTLDRVICCYRDAEALVVLSAARAKRIYGLVCPGTDGLSAHRSGSSTSASGFVAWRTVPMRTQAVDSRS